MSLGLTHLALNILLNADLFFFEGLVLKLVIAVLWKHDFVSVVRMKGEENSVMRDYVLPDFSSIKKGFCKVRELFFRISDCRATCQSQSDVLFSKHCCCTHRSSSACPPATRGDGLQRKVQDRRADPEAGQWALCCPWDALPPIRYWHPGDGHPRGHCAFYPVSARRWDCLLAVPIQQSVRRPHKFHSVTVCKSWK